MHSSVMVRIAVLATIFAMSSSTAIAHPGTVAADGCHVCRKGCTRYGLADGTRHCHPERLEAPGNRGQDRGASHKTDQSADHRTANDPPPRASDRNRAAPSNRGDDEREIAVITHVTDGDTFRVKARSGSDKIRVLGIDCPESSHNAKCERDGRQGRAGCDAQVPRGVAAKRRAAALLDGRTVTLEGPFSRDPYGRRLAYIRMEDGQDYGLLMIREGRCEDFGWKYPHPRGATYRSAGR